MDTFAPIYNLNAPSLHAFYHDFQGYSVSHSLSPWLTKESQTKASPPFPLIWDFHSFLTDPSVLMLSPACLPSSLFPPSGEDLRCAGLICALAEFISRLGWWLSHSPCWGSSREGLQAGLGLCSHLRQHGCVLALALLTSGAVPVPREIMQSAAIPITI